jgi:hypothetical protein
MRRLASLALVVAATVTALAAAPAHAQQGGVRLNELQVIGTHNSYKREVSEAEQGVYDEVIGAAGIYDRFLAYSHARLTDQLGAQGVRGLELDLFGDPEGGRYAEPLVRRRLGLGPLPDPAWRVPGIKTLHIADADHATTCVRFTSCLREIEAWSDANPRHVPLLVLLELKRSEARIVEAGGVVAPAWDAAALDALDAEIRSVVGEDDVITPDDVRRPGLTLEGSVRRHGWPRLRAARGQVLFLLDNEPGAIRDAYTAGRPSLEGRVLFTNSRPGRPDAAFVKRNDPLGANEQEIRDLVRGGYLVRTRSDVPLTTVLNGDTAQLAAALGSGAHVVSTDFPVAGMAARYDSDFVARLPGGGTVRCNPVSAQATCRSDRLEPRWSLGSGSAP